MAKLSLLISNEAELKEQEGGVKLQGRNGVELIEEEDKVKLQNREGGGA